MNAIGAPVSFGLETRRALVASATNSKVLGIHCQDSSHHLTPAKKSIKRIGTRSLAQPITAAKHDFLFVLYVKNAASRHEPDPSPLVPVG